MSKKLHLAAASKDNNATHLVPLRTWMDNETTFSHKECIVRKLTIAYGILELFLRYCNTTTPTTKRCIDDKDDGCCEEEGSAPSLAEEILTIDNFTIHTSNDSPSPRHQHHQQPQQKRWDDITGVTMTSPALSLTIEEPAYLTLFEEEESAADGRRLGRYLEVEHLTMQGKDLTAENSMAGSASSSAEYVVTTAKRVSLENDGTLGTERCNAVSQEDCNGANNESNNNEQRGTTTTSRGYYAVAKLLYELFVNEAFKEDSPLAVLELATTIIDSTTDKNSSVEEPVCKKMKSSHHHHEIKSAGMKSSAIKRDLLPFQIPCVVRMQSLGIPASICRMVQNLLEAALSTSTSTGGNDDKGGSGYDETSSSGYRQSSSSHHHRESSSCYQDAYMSLREVVQDLHLLLLDPDRFAFDTEIQQQQQQQGMVSVQPQRTVSVQHQGTVSVQHQSNTDEKTSSSSSPIQLRYRKDKLYGRDKQETLITDAFCRVSRGKSEAFFIGGFSGCGKTMLVNTLRARVNCVGGYVIQYKFDALLSQEEQSLSGVISAVNQLCVMLKERSSSGNLVKIGKMIGEEFGVDGMALLVRILPNVGELLLNNDFSSLGGVTVVEDDGGGDTMNARSVGFTLLRFLRLVSSRKHPIMLFLDDLQWADGQALDVIHTFLSDTMGSCIFFVGTYRDNEVDSNHPIFDLMDKLETSHVPTSKVSLAGLDREDLNTMISDALCLYPRICNSLSNVVMKKTNGSPFFVLEFMKSLKDRGLLQYNFHQRRWVWDEELIRAEKITDNVMHLLSYEMNGLSDEMKLLLKVMACFGTCTNETVIDYLGECDEYAGVREGLKRAVGDGFVVRNQEGDFKFVHDKVREAAYNLIPESDKKEFHYKLGKELHSVTEGKDVGDKILLIASQIYHGKEFILKNDEIRIPIVKLNMAAGKKSMESCRHKTAYSYLEAASSLLPDNCWESYYDISLQLYFMMASAANSSCKYDDAEIILERILKEARCIDDKLPSYFLLTQIFPAQGNPNKAVATCKAVLTQLGETVPETVTTEMVGAMIPETLNMYSEIYGNDWLEKKMEDKTLCNIVKFYSSMVFAAYFCKAAHQVAYFICKVVQLSLQNGVCKHTSLAFLLISDIISRDGNNVALAHGIAHNAMALSKKFNISDQLAEHQLIFTHTVGHLECFHKGIHRLRGAFESALSSGNANMGFVCALQSLIFSITSGERELTLLLKEIDYYLHLLQTYKSETTRNMLLNSRETVSLLIDKGEATSIEAKGSGNVDDTANLQVYYFHRAFQSFWLGFRERCCHFAQKCFIEFPPPGRLYGTQIRFYHGLNLLDMLKKKSNPPKRKEVKEVIALMKIAVSHADSNFRNKLELLEAEKHGLDARHSQAVKLYDAAIASAKNAKFIHEQGLACEKAGFYYKKIRDIRNALDYFQQARACYEEWGSRVKVEAIQREIDGLNVDGVSLDATKAVGIHTLHA